jgi:hypothetical protein
MTKAQEFWSRIVKATPGFGQSDDTKVTMSIGEVRRLTAKAHKDGFRTGMQTAKSLEGMGKTSDPDIFDIFK